MMTKQKAWKYDLNTLAQAKKNENISNIDFSEWLLRCVPNESEKSKTEMKKVVS